MWLKWVIRSEISHLAESASNKGDLRLDHLGENDPAVDRIEYRAGHGLQVRPQANSPEEAIVAAETINSLLEACDGKPELEAIVYAISDGNCLPKPQSLAEYLGKSINEINQQLRALRRRASKIRIEAENGRE